MLAAVGVAQITNPSPAQTRSLRGHWRWVANVVDAHLFLIDLLRARLQLLADDALPVCCTAALQLC